MKKILFSILFLSSFLSQAQFVIEKPATKDTAFTIPMITVSYAYQWSAAEMADRFGPNSNIGGTFMVKTKKNWLYGFKGNFLWNGKVKNENILSNLTNDDGEVIDNPGRLTKIHLGQRGSSFFLFGGKMINNSVKYIKNRYFELWNRYFGIFNKKKYDAAEKLLIKLKNFGWNFMLTNH